MRYVETAGQMRSHISFFCLKASPILAGSAILSGLKKHALVLHSHILQCLLYFLCACLCLRTENRSRKTHVFEYRDCGVGWGGVGGHVNVPCTSYMIYCHAAKISGIIYYVTCCYAAEISGIVYYVTCCYAAEISGIVYYVTYMLLRCWDLWDYLLRYMLLRCWDLWYRLLRYMLLRCWDLWDRVLRYIHVATLLRSLVSFTTLQTCCYAAEISGIVYYVTCCYAAEISGIVYYVTCCYAAEISGIVYYVTCCYAAEISGIVYYVTYMLLRCWDLWDLWELGNGDAFTRMLLASCLLRMRCSDDAEKRKNAPQVFPGFPIIKLARHCGKITIFLKMCVLWERFPVRRDVYAFMPTAGVYDACRKHISSWTLSDRDFGPLPLCTAMLEMVQTNLVGGLGIW